MQRRKDSSKKEIDPPRKEEIDENVLKYSKVRTRKSLYLLIILVAVLSIGGMIIAYERITTVDDTTLPPRLTMTLKDLCNSTVWRPNLYLDCSAQPTSFSTPTMNVYDAQGTVNVRNSIVTCLRWAIDGGMGFILPNIAIRSEEDPKIFNSLGNITLLFDEVNLLQRLREECPKLNIYHKKDDVAPYKAVPTYADRYKRYFVGTYRKHVDDFVSKEGEQQKPIIICENSPLFGWNFYRDSLAVQNSLMQIVQFDQNIRDIGSSIASAIKVDFIGFHLRVEKDWIWTDYDSFVNTFIEIINIPQFDDINTIYVAIGSEETEEKFRTQMKSLNKDVISKRSIAKLNQTLFTQLSSLNFDQLAICDYEVLQRSTFFIGNGASSFTYAIARERGNGNLTECGCQLINSDSMWVPPKTIGPFSCCY